MLTAPPTINASLKPQAAAAPPQQPQKPFTMGFASKQESPLLALRPAAKARFSARPTINVCDDIDTLQLIA